MASCKPLCHKVCQVVVAGWWFFPGIPEWKMKVALNTLKH